MNNLYLIGGAERSGKTAILHKMLRVNSIITIQTDAIRDGLRKSFIDETSVVVGDLSFSGDVTFRRLGKDFDKGDVTKHFSKEASESELVWSVVAGLIAHYDNPARLKPKGSFVKGADLIVEGIEITPERVKSLNLKNFLVKPVFVGYTENTSFDKTIVDFKREGFKISEDKDDKVLFRKGFDEHVEKGKQIANDAHKYGYKFFSFDNDNFEEYCNNVAEYLLK